MSPELEECSNTFATKLTEYEYDFCQIYDQISIDYSYTPGNYIKTKEKTLEFLGSDFFPSAKEFAQCVIEYSSTQVGKEMLEEILKFIDAMESLVNDCDMDDSNYYRMVELKDDWNDGWLAMSTYLLDANMCLDVECELSYTFLHCFWRNSSP